MNQKSGKIENIYNNHVINQQKFPEIKTVNSYLDIQNSSYDQAIKQTNREIFMQDTTNYIVKNEQMHKEIKNSSFIQQFTSSIDDFNQKTSNCLNNKFDQTNTNNKSQMKYNDQNNTNYQEDQNSMAKQQNYNTIQQQSYLQVQNPKVSLQMKGMFQEGIFQGIENKSKNYIQIQNFEQSIIISECNLVELRQREGQTLKILERNLGIQKQANIQEFQTTKSKQIQTIKSDSINQIKQLEYTKQQTDQQVLKNREKKQQCDVSNEAIEVMKIDDDKISVEGPVKVRNQATTQIQLKEEKQLKQFNQVSQLSQGCSGLEFEVLKKIHQVRLNRLDGIKMDFFRAIERLEKSDCITDLVGDKQIVQLIITQFPYLRRVRGDGNCLFSSLLFPYLELIYVNNLFDNVLNQFVAHEIYWNKAVIIDPPIVFPLIKKIFQELKKLSKKCNNDLMMFSEVILHYMNQVNGFYDILIIFMRSTIIQSYKLYFQEGEYQYFLDEKTTEEFLEKNSSFEEEGDFLSIQFFCEISQIKVKLINFSDKHPIYSMQILEPKLNKVRQDQSNFITLKYNEGHYDILYSRMLKQIIIKEEERQLPQIEFTALY